MPELEGKIAIVTGAGRLRGMGRATVVALAKRGADVVMTGPGSAPASFPANETEVGWRNNESVDIIEAEGCRALPAVAVG